MEVCSLSRDRAGRRVLVGVAAWVGWRLVASLALSGSVSLIGSRCGAEVPAPPGVRSYVEFTTERDITYLRHGERELKADLFLPRLDGKRPAVLLIHGGGWMSGNKSRMFFHGRYLASRGYVALAIDYRLAPEHPHPAQMQDCRAALRWLWEHRDKYEIDTNRLAAYGYSAGGHLALLLGTADPDQTGELDGVAREGGPKGSTAHERVRAVVAGGAPCDLLTYPVEDRGLVFFLGQPRSTSRERYRRASPMYAVTRDDAATFLYHGDNDALVPVENSQSMAQRLRDAGVRVEHVVLADRNHIGAFMNRDVTADAVDFLDDVLHWKLP